MTESSSAVKAILSMGEEKMGEVVNQLLANEAFVVAVQKAITGGLQAKRNVDKGLSSMLGLMNLPTTEDVDKVRARLVEVEESLALIGERLQQLDARLDDSKSDEAPASDKAGKKPGGR